MSKSRFLRLLVIACIAAASLGSTLLISSDDTASTAGTAEQQRP